MEWESNHRRAKSLMSIPSSCDQPTWTDEGLQDRETSVSRLISRYQTTAEVSASIQDDLAYNVKSKPKQELKEIPPSPLEGKENILEVLILRSEERRRSRAKPSLAHRESTESLTNSSASVNALNAPFQTEGATQNKAKSLFRATSFTSLYEAADMPVMNGEIEEKKSLAEKRETQISAGRINDSAEDQFTRKMVNQTRERRKTIGGVDFEYIAASQADEKRRSIADFRDSSFLQTKEKLSVSVKAMSALYLSKTAPQGSIHSPLNSAHDQSSESGKRLRTAKMAEDSQKRKDDLPPLPLTRYQPGQEDISGAHFQQSMPSQLSKEKLYQQRQKCELRRLLKHTHPELKVLDDVVDEELAEVLSSETGVTTGETGYEGEVLSRRLIFENCALTDKVSPYIPKRHMAEGTVEKGDVSEKSAVVEEHEEKPCSKSVKGIMKDDEVPSSSPDPNTDEEMIRIDVKATRRIFESQSVNTSRLYPDNKFQGKVLTFGIETETIQKHQQKCRKEGINSESKSNVCTKSFDLADQPHKQELTIAGTDHQFSDREEFSTIETVFEDEDELTRLPDPQNFGETIKTSATLFENNPFIQTNIERENSFVYTPKSQSPVGHSGAAQDYPIDNVKNRTHLFESMPFNKIRHQNKDEVETMVENIKETLNSLHQVNAIHSGGSIIEVNETMIAKKAKFALSEAGPEIKYDEVAEGGAQNFILQLLPRTNLKPQIIYLKEDCKGTMETAVVNVPVHHHQFAIDQDTEFKTANVVQVAEDILNQDNSLRKGVIIQEDVDGCAEIIVYSLYNYFDEEDVKSYCPSQGEKYDEPEPEKEDLSKTENQGLRGGAIESTISFLLETSEAQTSQGPIRPEITEKGNVKLFKCCIEKGDLEYLKSLQAESTEQEQELPPIQNVAGHHTQTGDQAEESASEFAPVDVKKLKNMFSGGQIPTQPKQDVCENLAQSTTMSSFASQNVLLGKSQPFAKCDGGVISDGQLKNTCRECGNQKQEEACKFTVAPQESYLHLEDDSMIHKAELVEVVDDNDEIDNLQTAIHNLRQATIEAKSLYHLSQEKQKFLAPEFSKKSVVLVAAGNVGHSRTEVELPQDNGVQKDDPCVMQPKLDEVPSASNITSDCQSENTERSCRDSKEVKINNTCSKMGQEGTKDVQKPASVSVHSSETIATQQEDDEVVLQGKLQAALNSLEKSNINVTRGDFRAAMIYKTSSKPYKQISQNMDTVSYQKHSKEEFCPVTEPKSSQAPLGQKISKEHVNSAKAGFPSQSTILNKPAASAVLETRKRPVGPKPAIPPKPDHLKVNQRDIQSTIAKTLEPTQTNPVRPKETVPQPLSITLLSCKDEDKHDMFKINSGANTGPDLQTNNLFNKTIPMSQEIKVSHQVQGSAVTLESDNTDKDAINQQQEMTVPLEKKKTQTFLIKDNTNETDESHVDFQGACKKFEGKNVFSAKNPPVKPKRVKIAQFEKKNPKYMSGDNKSSLLAEVFQESQQSPSGPSFSASKTCGQTPDTKDKQEKDIQQESKVEMREKKGRSETEDERRQRLSVHMDEIMRGNIPAAMEIFDNLRKQEELQSILSRVEEIEQDTREVDVRSLRGVFENVPDWVVYSNKKKQKKAEVENKDERMLPTRDTESKSSVSHVFGDLERASEEIMNLKEQTLSRLMDIEEAIKKALYSVSALKSDSDIAGLSCLFKESLGTVRGSPCSGNISKISIGSSRTKSVPIHESPISQGNTALPVSQKASIEVGSAKQQASPPSSPAFISIQSAARKSGKTEVLPSETTICPACQHSPKTEEKFRSTKTLTCNSPARDRKKDPRKGGQKHASYKPPNPNTELSVPEMQTDPEVNNIMGTQTVTENYERTDNLGNRFYSSKTSTVVTAQPETTTSTGQAVVSPAMYQVTKYPEVWLPINQKP